MAEAQVPPEVAAELDRLAAKANTPKEKQEVLMAGLFARAFADFVATQKKPAT